MRVYFNSRDIRFKEPFGAVTCGTEVTFRVETADADGVVLRIWRNGSGEEKHEMQKNGGFFEVSFNVPETPGILWYYFLVYKDGRCLFYGNSEDKLGGEGRLLDYEPDSFQLTVYKPIHTPGWFKSAVVYYIFPDRFNRGTDFEKRKEKAKKRDGGNGPGYFYEDDWHKRPYYEKNEDGSIKRWQFYGGTLKGITEKLPYIKSLGATAIYLCPVFEAESNHRYDTADYLKIDPLLGDEESFKELVGEAQKLKINIILDGVFSHTGCDSIYFDRFGNYGGNGAFGNPDSPYRNWYRFSEDGTGYEAWWGDKNLPNVDELEPGHNEFICGENGVLNKWLDLGVKGFRLDVADELPDEFIKNIRKTLKDRPDGEDNILIGEVWEDASNKISYGEQREFVYGEELDSVLNYPWRGAVIDFLLGRISAERFSRLILSLYENYPKEIMYSVLNILGSHDCERPLTLFGDAGNVPDEAKQGFYLSEGQLSLAKKRVKAAMLFQYCLPGVPAIYYGDEAGAEGYADPYNRGTYPWGRENRELLEYCKKSGIIYKQHPALQDGDFKIYPIGDDVIAVERENAFERLVAFVNRDTQKSVVVSCAVKEAGKAIELFSGKEHTGAASVMLNIPPLETALLYLP